MRTIAYPALPRPSATNIVAGATAAAGLVAAALDPQGLAFLAAGFIPVRLEGAELPPDLWGVPAWLTPLSATLVHGGVLHLAMNLVMLVFLGRQLEPVMGARQMLVVYLAGAYAAAASQWAASWLPAGWPLTPDPAAPMVGASGAIAALLGVYSLLFGRPRTPALGPLSPLAVHGLWLTAAWTAVNLMMIAVLPIAWAAHVGGFVAGLLLARPMLQWKWRVAPRRPA